LLQRPKKKAAILKKFIESPSTSKVLSGQGLTLTPACKKKLPSSRCYGRFSERKYILSKKQWSKGQRKATCI